ncbi:MAG: hypothetical protein A2900_04060 [Candidatus Chisholmbacteria bacterium RIFCSPLOWO2_01_FULL_50_28]|uniref:DUF4178 domain-containing protein n=1 Tax=Candidatus Chisholmbacteria bacterium RIFCSPHIGHO2_01_FULL_52_32 TaxID=1797591 RepID=A0A1G1VSK0_9BACT|nr:MAG: hypothetical protein A2786_02685 [Candidatus Chisholmbacteria bacterium RIFCSPHIGHO2_01_FULL_52_32]OGY20244.1 MAG: hypothetical protein A2900_04060 [Candidatus Chisholmbacteria bacterium RIFCSPLOWO2_01_FULL_50_28]
MYQTIGETISVLGIFRETSFVPKTFHWHNRAYPIEEITSIHEVKDESIKKRRYAVLSNGNLYLLEYNRTTETWILEQIWMEG